MEGLKDVPNASLLFVLARVPSRDPTFDSVGLFPTVERGTM
jgi:hypothetical protein